MLPSRPFVLVAVTLALTAGASFAQFEALSYDTVGASPQTVSPPGSYAFSVDGDVELGGFLFKDGAPFLHNDGGSPSHNTAVGMNALVSSTPGVPYSYSGRWNTASGANALQNNTTGYKNTASGAGALQNNTAGYRDTASGESALRNNTTGTQNTASGYSALVGNTTGNFNTALGSAAGAFNTTGSNNVWIANQGIYPGTESNTLRIGGGTGTGFFQQDRAFIAGIRNATGGGFDQDVCVNSTTDQLGPCDASSARFKEDIADLEGDSEAVFDLRPVRFRYKRELVGEGEARPIKYGLIAEEVAQVYPELVTYDADGQPMTVRYQALTPLLLNELKKERARNDRQAAEIASLRADRERLDELTARLVRLEALEVNREQPAQVARR